MKNENIKQETVNGAIWKLGERFFSQSISFVVSIILARLLAPDDYGLIALVFVFTTICDKIVICGFATSLIQKKDADNYDFSSVLFFSLSVAFLLYGILYYSAPIISNFYSKYDSQLLVSVVRTLGLSLFVIAFTSVQQAYVSKNMQFQKLFWATLIGTIVSGSVGIIFAYNGLGVWSLVAQNLINTIVVGIVVFITVKWRPIFFFSWNRLGGLFPFGWKIFCASIIKTIYNELRSLCIGKVYTPADLAYYNRGQSLPQLVESNVVGTIDSVLFPAYSKLQEDKPAMLSAVRRAVSTSCFVLMPLLSLMAAMASPLVSLLLTDKWLPCVPFMQILCFSFIFSPVEVENLQAIKAIGRSDIVLKLEIIKKTIGVLLLVVSIPLGLKAMAYSMLVSCIIAAILNAYPNSKLLGYKLTQQFQDILPSAIMSAVVFGSAYMVASLMHDWSSFSLVLIEFSVSAFVYLLLSKIFKVESFAYLISLLSHYFNLKGHNKL